MAVLLLFVWAGDIPVFASVGTAVLVGLLTVPLWVRALPRFGLAKPTMLLGALTVLAGVLLAVHQSNARPFDAGAGFQQVAILLAAFAGIGLILWARCLLSVGVIAVVLGLGRLAGSLDQVFAVDNPWKFVLAIPLSMIVLGLLAGRSTWIQIAGLLGLAVVNVVFDTRGFAGLCVLAAFFLVLQKLRFRPPGGWAGTAVVAAMGAVAVWSIYSLGTSLAISGRLGADIAARTEEQVRVAGSLIAGARPEWIGTSGLMQDHPMGYGFGAVPIYEDVWAARQGLYTAGVGSSSGYVDNYMFGGDFRLHSGAADLWAQAGLVGLAFAAYLMLVLFAGLAGQLRNQALTAVGGLLVAKALWDLGFSPLFSSAAGIAVAIGLVMEERDDETTDNVAADAKQPISASPAQIPLRWPG